MKSQLRLLLISLLLAALPLQGFAAGAMLFCGVGHPGAQSSRMDHAAHGHAEHVHAVTTHEHREPSPDAGSSSMFDLAGLPHGACSVCASCCSGAALPAATFASAFGVQRAAPVLPSEQPASERAPTPLERPPRTTLA